MKVIGVLALAVGWLFILAGVFFSLDAFIPKSHGPDPFWSEILFGLLALAIGLVIRVAGKREIKTGSGKDSPH
jgi:uncharacterized membrane protein HdeD (DUF308 family)